MEIKIQIKGYGIESGLHFISSSEKDELEGLAKYTNVHLSSIISNNDNDIIRDWRNGIMFSDGYCSEYDEKNKTYITIDNKYKKELPLSDITFLLDRISIRNLITERMPSDKDYILYVSKLEEGCSKYYVDIDADEIFEINKLKVRIRYFDDITYNKLITSISYANEYMKFEFEGNTKTGFGAEIISIDNLLKI